MARRRQAGRGGRAVAADVPASKSKDKKKKVMTKEQRVKLIKSLTATLEGIAQQVAKYNKIPDDLDLTAIAAQYS